VNEMSEGPLVRTALYDEHVKLDGNIVDFHGFELPIWYSNIKAEHLATRESSGLFDVSHMGTFRFSGENVRQWLEGIATQKVTSIIEAFGTPSISVSETTANIISSMMNPSRSRKCV